MADTGRTYARTVTQKWGEMVFPEGDEEGRWLDPAGGVLRPGLELAGWLDLYVDWLLRSGTDNDGTRAWEERVDLMVGLSNAAEALRASERCDHESAGRSLRSAVELMRGIDLDRFALSAY